VTSSDLVTGGFPAVATAMRKPVNALNVAQGKEPETPC